MATKVASSPLSSTSQTLILMSLLARKYNNIQFMQCLNDLKKDWFLVRRGEATWSTIKSLFLLLNCTYFYTFTGLQQPRYLMNFAAVLLFMKSEERYIFHTVQFYWNRNIDLNMRHNYGRTISYHCFKIE